MATVKHVKTKSKWKNVDLSSLMGGNIEFNEIISLQELTDYELTGSTTNKRAKGRIQDKDDDSLQMKKKKGTDKLEKSKSDSKKNVKEKKNKNNAINTGKDKNTNETLTEEEKKKRKLEKKLKTKEKIKKLKERRRKKAKVAQENDIVGESENAQSPQQKKRKAKPSEDDQPVKKKQKKDTIVSETKGPVNKSIKGMEAWTDMCIPEEVLWALRDQGFTHPSPIQREVLPFAIRDKMDILGAAETGSGKTLAFGIPVIHFILEEKKRTAERESLNANEEDAGSDDEDDENDDVDENDGNVEENNTNSTQEQMEGKSEEDEDDEEIDDDDEEEENDDEEEEENEANGDDTEDVKDQESEQTNEEVIEGDGIGCVKVIDNADFSWMDVPGAKANPSNTPTHPRALILEPTRELAIQVKNHLLAAAKYTKLKIATIVGGLSLQKQRRILSKCPDIIVATPGRLWELVLEGEVFLSEIEKTKYLVVDEADRMIEKGHFEELAKLLERMKRIGDNSRRRTYVFSATLTFIHSGPVRVMKKTKKKYNEKQKLAYLVRKMGLNSKPKIVDITKKIGTVETLCEARINCAKEEKDVYLYYFLKHYPGRTLVFTNSKDCIRRLVSIFTMLQCSPLPLHADMHQRQRLKNLDRFTENPRGFLIASDVAARGLDIPNIQHVIHYQIPHTVENYVHRSGRTARAMKEGLSVMLIGPEDAKNYRKIVQNLNKSEDLPIFPIDPHSLHEISRRVNLVREIETQEYRFNKKKRQNDWFIKSAEEAGLEIGDELLNDLGEEEDQNQERQYIKQMKLNLANLLKQPVLDKSAYTKYPTKSGRLLELPQTESTIDALESVKKLKKDKPASATETSPELPTRSQRRRQLRRAKMREKMKNKED